MLSDIAVVCMALLFIGTVIDIIIHTRKTKPKIKVHHTAEKAA